MERKSVIVYGFARSGTSMTCGVLNCLGFNIITEEGTPEQLRHNPKGMFELGEIIDIGHEINKKIRVNLDEALDCTKIAQELKQVMESNLIPYIPNEGNWGIKAPTIYGIDVLLHYMPNPHILCIHRNIVDQSKSFQVFNYKREQVKLRLEDIIVNLSKNYMHVANEAQRLSNKYPVAFTTYEGLKNSPWEEALKIADFLGVVPTDEMKQNVWNFIDKDLHTWKDEGKNTIPIEIDLSKYTN